MASKRGIPPTVCNFQTLLTSKLTQHDVRESKREMKRGSPNIYRIGHLLKAAHEVEADVARSVPNCNVVMTPEIAATMRAALRRRFNSGFRPVENVEKQINAFLTTGQEPSLLRGARRRH